MPKTWTIKAIKGMGIRSETKDLQPFQSTQTREEACSRTLYIEVAFTNGLGTFLFHDSVQMIKSLNTKLGVQRF